MICSKELFLFLRLFLEYFPIFANRDFVVSVVEAYLFSFVIGIAFRLLLPNICEKA